MARKSKIIVAILIALFLISSGILAWLVKTNQLDGRADIIIPPNLPSLIAYPEFRENPKGDEVRFYLKNISNSRIPIIQSDPWRILVKVPCTLFTCPPPLAIFTPDHFAIATVIEPYSKILYAWNSRLKNDPSSPAPVGTYYIQFQIQRFPIGPIGSSTKYYNIPLAQFKITPVKLSMSASNYNVGQEIQFTIKNVDTTPITFPNADPWEIRDSTNKVVSTPSSTSAPFILPAGASYSRVISPLGANGKVLPAGEYTFIILSSNPDDPYNRARFTIGNEPPISPSTTPTNTPAPAD